jgi:mannosylfructose-phosphate synthase
MATAKDMTGFQRNHERFLQSTRGHVLMLTTHGVHQWHVVPGLPDTGGQNVFVNHFSEALIGQGYRVTIANRGGYPHPELAIRQEGLHYKDAFQRLIYLEDGQDNFVRKEDMSGQVGALAEYLAEFLQVEGTHVDVIISHYWDGARVGELFNRSLPRSKPHIWVPHSLGMVKKKNVSEDKWGPLRIDERIEVEKHLLSDLEVVAATSSKIRESLIEDYGFKGKIPFLPPCVDHHRYQPTRVDEDDEIWTFLADHTSMGVSELRKVKFITEISRTDTTKRKDILIQAFAKVLEEVPDTRLMISIDQRQQELAEKLQKQIHDLGVGGKVIVLGSVWERLPKIYAITDIYCTPSVMEGFGMSAQEAAATGIPVVASNLVPFVREYLLGSHAIEIPCEGCEKPFVLGDGAIEVQADDVSGFAHALVKLLQDDVLRKSMGKRALEITVPFFTWTSRTQEFLKDVGLDVEE